MSNYFCLAPGASRRAKSEGACKCGSVGAWERVLAPSPLRPLASMLYVLCSPHKLIGCVFVLAMALLLADMSAAAPYFRGTGLMNIPTAYVAQQGFFSLGVHTAVWDQKRDELGIRIDFGVFSFAELGLIGLKKEGDDYVMGNAKLLLSRESGSTPGLSVGMDNFGEEIQNGSEGYRRSVYGVVSKQFNLPIVHLISGHLGIGNHRYVAETSIGKYLHGVFMGLSKELHLSFLDSQLYLMCEADGKDLNAGLRYMMDSGLSISVATGQLSSDPKDIKYYLGIGFTNAPVMRKIDQSSELAKRAVKIANEGRSDADK